MAETAPLGRLADDSFPTSVRRMRLLQPDPQFHFSTRPTIEPGGGCWAHRRGCSQIAHLLQLWPQRVGLFASHEPM